MTMTSIPGSTPPQTSRPYPPRDRSATRVFIYGVISALLALFIIPEILGSAAIVLGAYTWRMERDDSRSRGLALLVFGIICMLVGIYFTSYFALIDLVPA
jgi:membrane-bound ClpP family serine protease